MSQHVDNTCDESNGQWLPLTEYSVKSGISTSTIRRKIKSNSIQYRLENGRYLILCSVTQKAITQQPQPAEKLEVRVVEPKKVSQPVAFVTTANVVKAEADATVLPLVDRAVQMVSDAYERALKEKDERISLLQNRAEELKERLNELRTLVRALEEKYEVRY